MAKRLRQTTSNTIEKRIKEGRGQGRGVDYKPWLSIQDVPSKGCCTREKGWKARRIHHVLSGLELQYLYTLEWSPIIGDIREQYPLLPLEETLHIAEQLGTKHPTDPKTKYPIVMTTDFLITVNQKIGELEQARTIKPSSDLRDTRTLEKLEIERRYWECRSISWGIVTEQEIPKILAQNVEILHPYFYPECLPLSTYEIQQVTTLLSQWILDKEHSLAKLAHECDLKLGLKPGDSLAVAWHLLATQQWRVDMNHLIQPRRKLWLLPTSEERQ